LALAAQHRDALSQIQAIAQVENASVPLSDLSGRRRRQQPLRKGLLPHPGPGRAEQLEETSFAKEVQIGGVDVMEVAESLSPVAAAGPSVFEASQPSSIELRNPPVA